MGDLCAESTKNHQNKRGRKGGGGAASRSAVGAHLLAVLSFYGNLGGCLEPAKSLKPSYFGASPSWRAQVLARSPPLRADGSPPLLWQLIQSKHRGRQGAKA